MHIDRLDDLPYLIAVGLLSLIYMASSSQEEIKNQTETSHFSDLEAEVASVQLVSLTPSQTKTLTGIKNQVFMRENLATMLPVVEINDPRIEPISAVEPPQAVTLMPQVVPLESVEPRIDKMLTVDSLKSQTRSLFRPVSYEQVIADLDKREAKDAQLDKLVTQVAWPSSSTAQVKVFEALRSCARGRIVAIKTTQSGVASAEHVISELSKLRRSDESSLVRKIPSKVMSVLTQQGVVKNLSTNNSFMFFPNQLDVMIKTKLNSLTLEGSSAQMFFEYEVSDGYLQMKLVQEKDSRPKRVAVCTV